MSRQRWRPDADGIRVLRAKQQRRPGRPFAPVEPPARAHGLEERVDAEEHVLQELPLPLDLHALEIIAGSVDQVARSADVERQIVIDHLLRCCQQGRHEREGFIDFGNFESEGNVLTMAVGANAVLIKERLEIGAVYTTVLAAQHNFEANGLLVKMMLRMVWLSKPSADAKPRATGGTSTTPLPKDGGAKQK